MRLQLNITLKSGATIHADVSEATYKSNPLGGKQLHWVTSDDWGTKILHVDMDEVVAITVTDKDA